MIPFGRNERGEAHGTGGTPPPNYFSRGVQVKLLAMVFLFMAVLWLMFEARQPENWKWMWELEQRHGSRHVTSADSPSRRSAAEKSTGSADRKALNTWAPLEPVADQEKSSPRVSGTDQLSWPFEQQNAKQAPPSPEMQLDGWTYVLRRLNKDERKRLQNGLWRGRQQQRFSETQRAAWAALVQTLDDNWADYHAYARRSISEDRTALTEEQVQTSVEIIEASQTLWNARKDALEAIAQDTQVGRKHAARVADLQNILDQYAWAQVKDNCVLRSAETAAWYRCWEQLRSLSPQQLDEAGGPVNFVQLFSQPAELRGRLITVRGTVRWAYRVASRRPRFGIDGYVVLGLLSREGGDSPIVVYCRELPRGFPAVGAADEAGQGGMLDEDVEITGYYFKRWLHRCEAGMNLSPLILGKVTNWHRHATVAQRPRRPISKTMALLATGGVALFSVLIALAVYRSSSWSTLGSTRSVVPPGTLPSFDTQNIRASVSHSLREFASQQNDGEASHRGDHHAGLR